MTRKEKRDHAQPGSNKSVPVRCPNCQTLWRCYGMRNQSYYTCVVCNHRFKLLRAWLSDRGSGVTKGSGHHRLSRQPQR